MKQSEVQTKVLKGERLLVGTLLGEEVREVASRKDGHAMFFHEVAVLNSGEVISVSVPTGKEVRSKSDVKLLGIKENSPVVVEFSELSKSSYGIRARGKVHLLEA